jgi:HK97 family phage prohead protease
MSKNKDVLVRAVFGIDDVEIRKDDEGKIKGLTGYAARFEKLSVPFWSFREKIRAGAFKDSLKENNVRALWNHNTDIVLGATGAGTLELKEDKKGLRFDLDLPDTQAGHDAAVSVERGDVDGMSFGFRVLREEWNEKDPKNVVRTLVEVDVREISFTAFPAYPDTSVKARSIQDDYAEYKKEITDTEKEKRVNELKLKRQRIDAL